MGCTGVLNILSATPNNVIFIQLAILSTGDILLCEKHFLPDQSKNWCVGRRLLLMYKIIIYTSYFFSLIENLINKI